MNRRLLTILLVALVIAGACTVTVFRLVGGRVAAERKTPTTRVVAAVRDVKLGAVLNPSDLTTIEIVGATPKGAIVKPEEAVGRGATAEIVQGEPILESRLAPRGSGGGLASTIPQGMRACAVRVDEVVGVSGFATPGMRVDVLATGQRMGQLLPQESGVARTILQNIQVLSTGTDMQKDAEGKARSMQVVNLLVTPEQAEALSLASNQMRIQLVLRNPLDTRIVPVAGLAMSGILGDAPMVATAPLPARPLLPRAPHPVSGSGAYTVEVINGASRTEQKFNSPEARP
jgi:pilus assembly protein CpaB